MSKDDADSDRSGRFTARLRGVLRRKGAIAVILLPAFTIGGLVAYLSPPRFTATAVIRIDSSSAATPKARLPASERESLAATHAALVVDPDLAARGDSPLPGPTNSGHGWQARRGPFEARQHCDIG